MASNGSTDPNITRLAESNIRLADAVLILKDQVVKQQSMLDRMRQELRELVRSRESDHNELRYRLERIGERLAVIGQEVNDVERDITGRFPLQTNAPTPPEDHRTVLARSFAGLPRWTQAAILAAMCLIATTGFVLWLIEKLHH